MTCIRESFRFAAIVLLALGCSASMAVSAEATGSGGPLSGLEQLKPGRTMRASSSDVNDWKNGNADARPIAPGKTLVIADLQGPGRIQHIWNTIATQERGASRLVVIRMYWDGEETPSVEAPLGDFFIIGHGINRPVQSLPVVVSSEGRARNCYWPMPFGKSARITLTNEGESPVHAFYSYVDWQKLPDLPPGTAYFHATYRQEHPTQLGRNYLIADITGQGHFVGTVMNIRQRAAGWYGEGDDFFYIDGEEEPSLRGTGSEDYFCDAWGFRKFDGPYYGVPVWGKYKAMGLITAYRWHLTDPVSFTKSLRVEIEHKGAAFNEDGTVRSGYEEREDDFSSVAYWYQTEPHKPFAPLPPAYDRLYVDYRTMVEAETRIDSAKASEGDVEPQEGGQWSGNAQLFWQPPTEGQTLELSFSVEKSGVYDLLLVLTNSWDYGICQVEVDGTPLGEPIDQYGEVIETNEHTLAGVTLEAGEYTITFRNVGKADKSDGYFLGFDGLVASPRK